MDTSITVPHFADTWHYQLGAKGFTHIADELERLTAYSHAYAWRAHFIAAHGDTTPVRRAAADLFNWHAHYGTHNSIDNSLAYLSRAGIEWIRTHWAELQASGWIVAGGNGAPALTFPPPQRKT